MFNRLLIANRGEIAIRIARTAADLGVATVAIHAEDDAQSLHTRHADTSLTLGAVGVPAYLDGAHIISLAVESGCDALHPGYGFLSESAAFASACEAAGLAFVGPSPETLALFGDKTQARLLAQRCDIPVSAGISDALTLSQAQAFFASRPAGAGVMLKAVAGGGGRGMRPVQRVEDLPEAFERASSEALQAFGDGALYIEELIPWARHIEVQIIGDGSGEVSHLWDRECSLQRQRQKLVEVAPAFGIPERLRAEILDAARRLAQAAAYRGAGTFEFLVDADPVGSERFVFIEANARLQVEHTVTEAVTGLDLVAIQLKIAAGATLSSLGLLQADVPSARGTAIQARVNLETMNADGSSRPGGGLLTTYEPPSGPGIRVDGFGYAGYATSPRYDSLLAKLIVHADDRAAALARARRALSEFKISGARTNVSFLQSLLSSPALIDGALYTKYVDEHAAELLEMEPERARYFPPPERDVRKAGARVDPNDPLAVLSLRAPSAATPSPGDGTARENIYDLCDPESFVEYGALVTATRTPKDTIEELEMRVSRTTADAMVMGVGRVNRDLVGRERARCVAMSYDYSVLAGTQGRKNHEKQDRMFGVAERYRLPVVLFTEGGGGRTHGGRLAGTNTQATSVGGLSTRTWRQLGKLSGLVPLVGVTSGYCFAGNVVLLGACDVIIATKDSSIGIGGPAVIEGGGLGVYAPAEVGPVSIQQPNGVIDILVEDEAEATQAAKHYLSFFQGPAAEWSAHDQRVLRAIVPENRRAVYSIRTVIETLGDVGSMLELRPKFGLSMVTAFIRIAGRSVGVIANNSNSPTGGAIDSEGADKASRFMQLCDAFDIPILSLIDTPGNMVGPEAEKTALIRHCGRMYVAGANLTVPYFAVVLRKAYGLGALAMSTGSFDETFFTVAWPTGEFAGMGLEGSVKLGRRAELSAISDLSKRKARYDQLVDEAYAWSRALNAATVFEVDDVIDPADTRKWLVMGLDSLPPVTARSGKKHAWVDTW